MGGSPPVVKWRGIYTDPTTALALTELAAISGEIYCKPIPGCGSYQTDTKASADTHAGGGAVDLDCEHLTLAQSLRLETLARSIGFTAYYRPRYRKDGTAYGWQRHLHLIRSDCADLSAAAAAQVREYRAGGDGLVGSNPDTGSRDYVYVTWASYLKSKEDAMPTAAEIAAAVWAYPIKHPNPNGPTPTIPASSSQWSANYYAWQGYTKAIEARDSARVANDNALKALAAIQAAPAPTLDVAAVAAAVREAISETLADEILDKVAARLGA